MCRSSATQGCYRTTHHGRSGSPSRCQAHGKGLMLSILRYANELRDPKPYFEGHRWGGSPRMRSSSPPNLLKLNPAGSSQGDAEPVCGGSSRLSNGEGRAPEGKRDKSSTSWLLEMRAWRLRAGPGCETRCGSEWESSHKRNPQRNLHGPDRAHGARPLVVMHPPVSHGSREKNGDDLRADHSEPHYSDSYVLAAR